MKKKIKSHNQLLKHGFQKITPLDGAKLYADLKQVVTKEGILNRSYTFYTFMSIGILSGFLISGFFVVTTPLSIQLVFWALLFTFFGVQIAGLLHDAGHRAIAKTSRNNDIIGYIYGVLIALGFSSWKIKHNLHHAHTNQEGEDPDIELPLLSFTKERFNSKRGLPRLLVRYQAYLYFPLGVLVAFSARITSIRFFYKHFKPMMIPEIIFFFISMFVWFVLPFFIFDLSKAITVFVVINVATGFYLLNVFAPNHKGMPHIDEGVKVSFLEQQIMTSRNVKASWIHDFLYMGLNYQIEHHLFPNTPRNKLKLITPHVLKICRKLKIEYTVIGAREQNKIILSELNRMGRLETA